MTIAHFSLLDWEKEYFQSKLPAHQHLFFDSQEIEPHLESIKGCDILSVFIYNQVNAKLIDSLPNLKLIVTRSTGFDHIDIVHAGEKKIPVCNVNAYGSHTIAEHTFGLLLGLAKYLSPLDSRTKNLDFTYKDHLGFELYGKTIGVIGSGRIGRNTIQIAKAFEMNILVFDVFEDEDLAEKFNFKYAKLDDVLRNSDILSLHVPLSDQTKHILSRHNLEKLKKGVVFINTARGGLIQNEDLIYALDQGIFAAAGLDTIDGEDEMYEGSITPDQENILKRPNVLFTPHSAYYTKDALQRIIDSTIENIVSFVNNEILETVN